MRYELPALKKVLQKTLTVLKYSSFPTCKHFSYISSNPATTANSASFQLLSARIFS